MLSLNFRKKSTEQQELERIEVLQKEVAEHRRKNEASYRAALAGSESLARLFSVLNDESNAALFFKMWLFFFFIGCSYCFKGQLPKKHTLSTTIPKEFNFHSDSRLKNHTDGGSAVDNPYKEMDFTSQLRKHPSSPVSTVTRISSWLMLLDDFKCLKCYCHSVVEGSKGNNHSQTLQPLQRKEEAWWGRSLYANGPADWRVSEPHSLPLSPA